MRCCVKSWLTLVLIGWNCGFAGGAPTDAVRIDTGLVRGTTSPGADDVRVFLGIPYAASTAGPNRWRPPQPVSPWEGTRECVAFGPACPQTPYPPESVYYRKPEPQSEDCLSLNIWTAAGRQERLPVMVWIHGGALTRGSGAVEIYDGTELARKGAVVVTINYRLGPLGFFAHPELSAESEHKASGNYGLLDQVAALEWVRRNIAQFGGDPGCVTVFGESAGSLSVNALVASPLARGLFHRAIGQSGTAFRPTPSLAEAEKQGQRLATAAGISGLAALRELPAEKLVEIFAKSGDGRANINIDGRLLPEDVRAIFAAGKQNDVPTITGSNANEMTTLAPLASRPKNVQALRAQVALLVGSPDEVNRLYPAPNDEEAVKAFLDLAGDVTFTLPARMWARWTTADSGKVYLYQFTRVTPFALTAGLGAFHAAEIAYAFDNLARLERPLEDADHKLADILSAYWVNFARTGDPNGPGLPPWAPYDPENEHYMDFGETVTPGAHLRKEKLDLLERLLERRLGQASQKAP